MMRVRFPKSGDVLTLNEDEGRIEEFPTVTVVIVSQEMMAGNYWEAVVLDIDIRQFPDNKPGDVWIVTESEMHYGDWRIVG